MAYYAFTISAQNTNTSAYYGVLFTSQLTVQQGSFTFYPTSVGATAVGTDATNINLQLPQVSRISGGVTLETSASSVTGNIYISPALSVPVTFTLYAFNPVGSVTVQPGETSKSFSFDVSNQQGVDAAGAAAVVQREAPQAQRPE